MKQGKIQQQFIQWTWPHNYFQDKKPQNQQQTHHFQDNINSKHAPFSGQKTTNHITRTIISAANTISRTISTANTISNQQQQTQQLITTAKFYQSHFQDNYHTTNHTLQF